MIVGEDPFDIEKINRIMLSRGWFFLEAAVLAMAAIEMACWDIMGKETGKPVHKLLGGCYRKRIPLSFEIGVDGWNPKEAADEALRWVKQDIKTLKIKIGSDPGNDIKVVKAIREAVGPDIELRVDPNGVWSPATALRQINKLEKYDIQFVEQPLPRWDLDGLAYLRSKVNVPITTCESTYSHYDVYKVVRKGAADYVNLDPHRTGGLLNWKKAAAICEAADIGISLHSGFENGVSNSANLSLYASTPHFVLAMESLYYLLGDDIIKTPFRYKGGFMEVPEGPGLGVELDQEKMKKYKSSETELGTPINIDYPKY
jgi:glucarate dehydratase